MEIILSYEDRILNALSELPNILGEHFVAREQRKIAAVSYVLQPLYDRVKSAEDALREIVSVRNRRLDVMRNRGIIFTDIGNTSNWQHVAFAMYTDLVEAATTASAALADAPGEVKQ